MTMSEWARKEVEIACKKENPDWDQASGQFDYGCGCYQSALKAYLTLMEDGHSGYSFGITAAILERLLHELPLTPIEDIPENWYDGSDEDQPLIKSDDGTVSQMCKRRFSLWKETRADGTVVFRDNERYVCYDESESFAGFHDGQAGRILDEMFPIKMPYFPEKERYKIEESTYLTDRKNGDLDTKAFWRVTTPGGEVVSINQFYAEIDNKWQRIDQETFKERVILHNKRIKDEADEC